MLEFLYKIPVVLGGYVVPALIVLTVVVFVHEMGHFLVARWCGIRVAAFSIGFGRQLFGFTDRRGTRWKLSAIPLGGYVRFEGDDNAASMPDPEKLATVPLAERVGLFYFAPLWKRALVVAAGPAANFLLAILIFATIFVFIGRPHIPPIVGSIEAGGTAERAGFKEQDRIISIDGQPIESFIDLQGAVMESGGEPLAIIVERDGERLALTAVAEREEISDPTGRKHPILTLGIEPHVPPVVGAVDPGTPASRAGIEVGDRVVSIDGRPVASFSEMQNIVKRSEGRELTVVFNREGTELTVSTAPQPREMVGEDGQKYQGLILGIRSSAGDLRRDDPLTAVWEGGVETVRIVDRTLGYLGQLVVGRESPSQLTGVIGIAQVTGAVPTVTGRIYLTAFLSISIGLFNLFPVPMLDGGHLFFYLIEAVRGRPLSPQLQDLGFRIGFALVIMLFIFVTFNDIANLPGIFS